MAEMGAQGWEGHWRQTTSMNRDRGKMAGGCQGDTGEVQEEDTGKQVRKGRLRPEYVQFLETGAVSVILPTERRGFWGLQMCFAKLFSHRSPTMLKVTK